MIVRYLRDTPTGTFFSILKPSGILDNTVYCVIDGAYQDNIEVNAVRLTGLHIGTLFALRNDALIGILDAKIWTRVRELQPTEDQKIYRCDKIRPQA